MTDILGPPPATTSAWTDYFCDPNLVPPEGAVVTHVLVHAPAAGATLHPRIERLVSGLQHEVAAAGPAFTHPGGGYAAAPLAAPFTVPAGTHRVAAGVSGTISRTAETTPRLFISGAGNISPSVGAIRNLTSGTAGMPALGYRTQDGGGSPPPPPPPSPPPPPPPGGGSGPRALAALGQSNGANLAAQSGALLLTTLLGCGIPAALHNYAVGGSEIAQWMPGAPLLNNAIAGYSAALAAGEAPGAAYWFHGESASSLATEALLYDEKVPQVIAAFRAGVGLPELPVVIVGLHANHEASRPYWPRVQIVQELMTTPGYAHFIPNSVFVSLADLDGTTDGVHLTQALLDAAARRVAVAFAGLFV